jgi:curved DNA-binding protein CbpA
MPPTRNFDPSINYYEVLDVPFTASKREITRAYRQLMRATHPDKFTEASQRHRAEERAKLLNAAYAVLSRTDTRREYDMSIRSNAVNDVLFQRYTGNTSAQQRLANYARRHPSPEMARAQRHAQRSALRSFLLFVALFIVALIVVVFVASLAAAALHASF